MPSEPLLDIDALLAPMEGESPAGASVEYTTRQELDEKRKEIRPDDFPPDDPMRPAEFRRADWPGIIDQCKEILTTSSKDLMIAARLTEALTREHGFGGLRDGLRLMRSMFDQCWDRMYPSIEDGDLEVRAAPFNWLDDPDRGARFPNTIRMVPMVQREDAPVGWMQWKQSHDGSGALTAEAFEAAVEAAPRESCQTLVEDLQAARDELDQLGPLLTEKLESYAPGLLEVRRGVEECLSLAEQILERKGLPPAPEEPAAEGAPIEVTDADLVPESPPSGSATRDELYRRLAETAEVLQRMEPHSPIPYLVRRAVELGGLSFPQLMRELIREQNVLTEMNRELGIKEEPLPAAEEPPPES
jgi:type VI secretion system protein ImpA